MKIIRLSKKQNKALKVDLGFPHRKLPTAELPQIIDQCKAGNPDAINTMIVGHAYLAALIVGRFLKHWKVTRRHKGQMISEAILSITKTVNNISESTDPKWFVNLLMTNIKYSIEKYLNENIAIVSASHRTNLRRSSDKKPLESHHGQPINENTAYTTDDFERLLFHLRDALETLQEYDAEEKFDRVLLFLHEDHGIERSSLSSTDMTLIRDLVGLT